MGPEFNLHHYEWEESYEAQHTKLDLLSYLLRDLLPFRVDISRTMFDKWWR